MIEQLPIINMIVFIGMALIIPLFKKRNFKLTTLLSFGALVFVIISSIILIYHVQTEGSFYYRFGNYERFIGIELLVDAYSTFFALFVVTLVTVIYVYSTGDATEGIVEREYGRYYILMFILLFAVWFCFSFLH